jgi:hypothetical protein
MLPRPFRAWILLACSTLPTACVTEEPLDLTDGELARDCDDGGEDDVAAPLSEG